MNTLPLELAFGALTKTAKGSWNLARGGPVKRGLLGAGIGGGVAAWNTRDMDSSNQRDRTIGAGILGGALLGSLGFRKGSIFGAAVPVPAISRMGSVLGAKGPGLHRTLGKSAIRTAGRAGMFFAEHPRTAIGIGAVAATGIGWGMYEGNVRSATLSPLGLAPGGELNPAYTPEMSQGGIASMTGGTGRLGTGSAIGLGLGQNARRFQGSTAGLTQGLHRRRHG